TVLTEFSPIALEAKLTGDHSFAWVKRNLTPREQYAVNRLGIPGLYFQREEQRYYPFGGLTAHAIGFTGIDNEGLAGLELALDPLLVGGHEPLALSLDLRIQHILADELSAAMAEFEAIGAAGVVLDIETGEVLALASLPTFDPHNPGAASADARFNRATLGIYELGSVFKIFTTAMALDEGVVTFDDGFDVSKPIKVSRFTINDYKPKKPYMTIPEIFMYSSNIGTVKMAMEAGTEAERSFLERLGLLRPATFELPEIGNPLVPSPWREINTMTIAYGHGLAVSPLMLAHAAAAVIGGGVLKPVTLIKRGPHETVVGERVMSERTSDQMRQLLRLTVEAGTGRNAEVPGYLVGGKTGTADKQRGHGYAGNARISSFLGAFPMDAPRYLIFAMLDEPHGNAKTYGYATGGWVAAPLVGRVIARLAPLVGVAPVAPADERGESPLLVKIKAAEGRRLASN
ncbi:MAG: peptidoglycan D,D-transpeptidase FtsI family protein, partial [Kiloniellales bacterium]